MTELIPALVNRRSGTAAAALEALREIGGFDIHEVGPEELGRVAEAVMARRPRRILVCGGDGSIATVAALASNTGIELAIVPGGTLNHLARHLGLPLDPREAARVARGGITRRLDAGRVNQALFLNTSSVGAYEVFVRRRERLERRWGYHLASLIAGLQILFRTPVTRITLEVDGVQRVYRTPLLFVGVGERELRIPSLGERSDHGRRGLHLMIIRNRTGARLAALALQAAARGLEAVARTPAMDSVIVDRCVIETPNDTASVDGELIPVGQPMEYCYLRELLTVVVAERRGDERAPAGGGA